MCWGRDGGAGEWHRSLLLGTVSFLAGHSGRLCGSERTGAFE
jgi:hypothetical protein